MRYFFSFISLENFPQSLPGTLVLASCTQLTPVSSTGFPIPCIPSPPLSWFTLTLAEYSLQQLLERGHMGDKLFETLVAAFSLWKFVGFFFLFPVFWNVLLLSTSDVKSSGLQLWEMSLSYSDVFSPLVCSVCPFWNLLFRCRIPWTGTSVLLFFFFLFPIIFWMRLSSNPFVGSFSILGWYF